MVWPRRGSRAGSMQPQAARAGKRKGRSASQIPGGEGGAPAAALGFGNARALMLARQRVGTPEPGRGSCRGCCAGRCGARRESKPAMVERQLGGAGGVTATSSGLATTDRRGPMALGSATSPGAVPKAGEGGEQ
jgi:hypothetical protein